jgi:hypothetical protein
MPRRKSLDEPPPPPRPRRLRRFLLQFTAAVLAAALVLAVVALLVPAARDFLLGRDRYQIAFADVDCNPPAPLTRSEFLDEVQYYSRQPDRFSLLEPSLDARLADAFRQHPWVRGASAEVHTGGVRVTVEYRQAVLAVMGRDLQVRAVDRDGVMLPKKASIPAGAPTLEGAPPARGDAGQPWGDPVVELAAKSAELLTADLKLTRLQWTPDGLVLWGADFKALWGKEATDLPGRADRLRGALAGRASLPRWGPWLHEIDLRPGADPVIRLIVREK